MVFEFGDTLNRFIDACLQNSTLNTIAHSPIWTAVVCVCVMMLIVFINIDTSVGQVVRFGFWATMCMVGLMILHNRVLMYEVESTARTIAQEEVFAPAPMLEHTTGYVAAKPKLPQE